MRLTMYDAVNLAEIPKDAAAVAGYVNGRWPTYPKLKMLFPRAHRLSIAVTAEADADCLDIERFDATPGQAPGWVRRQQGLHVWRPAVYCSLSDAENVLAILKAAGIRPSAIRLITAHYTGVPHICTYKCGLGFTGVADATQYTDRALGRNLDASLVLDSFFNPAVAPAVRRRLLRAWILAQRAHGVPWRVLKRSAKWRLWRRLGGK